MQSAGAKTERECEKNESQSSENDSDGRGVAKSAVACLHDDAAFGAAFRAAQPNSRAAARRANFERIVTDQHASGRVACERQAHGADCARARIA